MTVQEWVDLFLGVSVLSLIVAWICTRRMVGSVPGIKIGVERFVKRQYRTVAALLGMGMLLPTFAYAQEHAGGGEANLLLPDLKTRQ